MQLKLEIFFTKLDTDKIVYHRHTVDMSDKNEDPDITVTKLVANEIGQTPKMLGDKFVIHSTSWRYEEQGITLTYIVYSDKIDSADHSVKELLVKDLKIAQSDDPKKPRPEIIEEKNIISHAIRHLGFLARTNERGKYLGAINSENIELLEKAYTDLAGELRG